MTMLDRISAALAALAGRKPPPAAAASALARHGAAKRRAKVLRVMNTLRAEMGMAPYQP
jgi:hypothetical protein